IQAVVTTETQRRERNVAALDIRTMSERLRKITSADSITCRDYAHWDETYDEMISRNAKWLDMNIENGLASSFGFTIVLLQGRTGDVVYRKGTSNEALAGIGRYGLLERCLRGSHVSGMARLDGRAYVIVAYPVQRSDDTGRPRGMLVLARVVDTRMLSDLAPGTGHRVVFCSAEGEVTSAAHLGSFRALPQAVASAISGSRFPDGKTVEMSTDNNTSYGILPLHDLAGKPLGVLIDVRSIAAMMASLSVIKQMSVSLMLLCAVIAAVGFGYLSNRALALRAHRDELTGLYNHGYLQDYLRSQVQLAERYDRPLAVIMVDIDHFKFVNDSHGHATGDAVLKALAQTMLRTMRATDVAARYGGEE
ncbi:MAG: diguanylate cyclase, partial [Armatimonadota bacterium]